MWFLTHTPSVYMCMIVGVLTLGFFLGGGFLFVFVFFALTGLPTSPKDPPSLYLPSAKITAMHHSPWPFWKIGVLPTWAQPSCLHCRHFTEWATPYLSFEIYDFHYTTVVSRLKIALLFSQMEETYIKYHKYTMSHHCLSIIYHQTGLIIGIQAFGG